MIWRPTLPTALLLLAGCDQSSTSIADIGSQRAAAAEEGQIVCARAGSDDFARACTLDRQQRAEGLILTLRHPDGHFHRFLVTQDGRGVIAADGAEPAVVSVRRADEIEVALGGDRYRLPATVGSPAAPTK